MLKGALFDLDGIIADTASYHFTAWKKLIKNHFDTDLPNQLEEKTKGVSREDSLYYSRLSWYPSFRRKFQTVSS